MIEVTGEKLYKFFNMLNKIANEFLLNITETNMYYRTVDSSNVCMQECSIEKNNCITFTEEPKVVGMSLERVLPFVKDHRKEISICMDFQITNVEEGTYKLTLSSNGSKMEVNCPSPKVIRRQPNLPKFDSEPSVTFVLSVKDFKQSLKNICASGTKHHSDNIMIEIVDGVCTMKNKDKDIKHVFNVKSYSAIGRWCCHFSYDYLKNYLSSADSKEVLSIDLRTDHPLFVRAQSMDFNVFLLVPRICNDS